MPLKNLGDGPVEPLAGKVVIDTNNYYPERDGHIAELDDETTTTAEMAQAHLPTSKVVKAFNHIYAEHLTTKRSPSGTEHRRALVIAGDDAEAKAWVAEYIDRIGFGHLRRRPARRGLAHPAGHPRLRPGVRRRAAAAGDRGGQALPRHVSRGPRPPSRQTASAASSDSTAAFQAGLSAGQPSSVRRCASSPRR